MTEIESKVIAIIVDKLGKDESAVTLESNFITDLNADSLDMVEMVMEFENEFNIQIPDEDEGKIATVGEAVKYIEEKIAAA